MLAFVSVGSFSTGTLTTEFAFFSNPDSKQGDELLADRLRGPANVNEVLIVRSNDVTVDNATYEEFVSDLQQEILGLGDSIASIVTYFQTDNPALVSSDRLTTVLPLVMAGEFIEAEDNIEAVIEIVEAAAAEGVFEVFITGEATFSKDFADGNQEDAERGEAFGVPIALIILAIVFGALAAAILPVVMAIAAIMAAFGIVLVIGQAMQLQVFVQNLITMIGLAVGIDYSLLIVSRFREERINGLERDEAIVKTGATAGRAVLFSGLTVIIAVLGVLIVPHRVYFSVGLGMITVLIIAVAAAPTLLPALLRIMGDRVNKFRLPFVGTEKTGDDTGGFWDKISYGVMRRPAISLVLAIGVLVAASIPFFSINTGTSGVSELPDKFNAKQGFEVLQEEFGFGLNAPAEIVIDGDIGSAAVSGAIDALTASLGTSGLFGPATLTSNATNDLAWLSVPLTVGRRRRRALRRCATCATRRFPGRSPMSRPRFS